MERRERQMLRKTEKGRDRKKDRQRQKEMLVQQTTGVDGALVKLTHKYRYRFAIFQNTLASASTAGSFQQFMRLCGAQYCSGGGGRHAMGCSACCGTG